MAQKESTQSSKWASSLKRVFVGKNESPSSVFWLIILILFVRWAIVEPFKIPSGSMLPTLLIGDHLFVSKMAYDLRVPFTRNSMLKISDPKRGDVIVFRYPGPGPMHGKFYIKRIVGIPGDKIQVKGGVPYLNGKSYEQWRLSAKEVEDIPAFKYWEKNTVLREEIPGARNESHFIQRYGASLERLSEGARTLRFQTGKDCVEMNDQNYELYGYRANHLCEFTVPSNSFFVMGDNRDDSQDGRFFGFVERPEIMGRAVGIWMSVPLESWQMQQGFVQSVGHFLLGLVKMPFDPERRARIALEIE